MKLDKFLEMFFGLSEVVQMAIVFGLVGALVFGVYKVISYFHMRRVYAEEYRECDAPFYRRHKIRMPGK